MHICRENYDTAPKVSVFPFLKDSRRVFWDGVDICSVRDLEVCVRFRFFL